MEKRSFQKVVMVVERRDMFNEIVLKDSLLFFVSLVIQRDTMPAIVKEIEPEEEKVLAFVAESTATREKIVIHRRMNLKKLLR